MGKQIERQLFLEHLPRWESGFNKGKIDWNKSIGLEIDFIYDGLKGRFKVVGFDKNKSRITIGYNDEKCDIGTQSFLKVSINKILKIVKINYRANIGDVIKDENRDLVLTDKKYEPKRLYNGKIVNRKYYKYTCNICGYNEGWIEEYDLLTGGKKCDCCGGNMHSVLKGVNDIPTTASWMVKYFADPSEAKLYRKGSNQKIKARCPDCGRERIIKISDLNKARHLDCICSDR